MGFTVSLNSSYFYNTDWFNHVHSGYDEPQSLGWNPATAISDLDKDLGDDSELFHASISSFIKWEIILLISHWVFWELNELTHVKIDYKS